MWGISISINLCAMLFAIIALFVLLMAPVPQPGFALIPGVIVALVAWRWPVRRRLAAREAEALDWDEPHLAEVQADASRVAQTLCVGLTVVAATFMSMSTESS